MRSRRGIVARARGWLRARERVREHFELRVGRPPRMLRPINHVDHVQWYKFFYRDARLPMLADKVLVKDHIRECLGEGWTVPTLWTGTALPDSPSWPVPYILKANHGSGWNIIVTDDKPLDVTKARRQTNRWMKRVYGGWWGEWLYSKISPQLLVEPLLRVDGAIPLDLKMWTFHGKVRNIQLQDHPGHPNRGASNYSADWVRQPFIGKAIPEHPFDHPRPERLEEMVAAAGRLGTGFPFMRVDFYLLPDQPLIGELTFYPTSGFSPRLPLEYDDALGALWRMPNGALPWPWRMRRQQRAARTTITSGRLEIAHDHDSPPSGDAQTDPLRAPK